jgi:hypothetical protein
MKKLLNFGYALLGLAVLLVIGYLFYIVSMSFINKIDKINANIFVGLIAGTVTIVGYFITRYLERKKIIEQQIREQKLPIYEEFIDMVFQVFQSSKNGQAMSEEDLKKFFWNFNKKAILWLSDTTLKSYIIWKNSIQTNSSTSQTKEDTYETLVAFEKLVLSFRKDIGHENSNLKTGDLLSMFINDWNTFSKDKDTKLNS